MGGAAIDVPPHQRDVERDLSFQGRRKKYVEGGSEGQVVGHIQSGDWENRPEGWKVIRRPMIFVNFDDSKVPLDVFEERDLELLDRSLADERRAQYKESKFTGFYREGANSDTKYYTG